MKFFIGRLTVVEGNSGAMHFDDALLVAKDEAQAKDLNESRAMMWGGDDGQVVVGGSWWFNSKETGMFNVRNDSVHEVSASTFDDLKDRVYNVIGDRKTAEAESQEPAEAVKTLARRIGDQLVKHDAKVSHSKLLHAVAASVGLTDWQVAKHSQAEVKQAVALPQGVKVEVLPLPDGRHQVDGYVDDVRIIEIDNRLDTKSWYLGQAGTLPWKHVDAKRALACVNAVFAKVDALSAGKGNEVVTAEKPWYPGGNWPTTKLEDIRKFDFAARVNAIWLTHGDVELAAKLLHVAPEALMNSFVDPVEADTAFCGRMADWKPQHSLSPNLSMASWQGHPNGFSISCSRSMGNQSFLEMDGYLGKMKFFQLSGCLDRVNPTFNWRGNKLPTSLREVGLLTECLNEALRQSYEEMSSTWTPPKD